jgi:hypothetical protein
MYRLDLDDPRLYLPVPIYRAEGKGERGAVYRARPELPEEADQVSLAFFAPDRPRKGTVAVVEEPVAQGGGQEPRAPAGVGVKLTLQVPAASGETSEALTVAFYALPPDHPAGPNDPTVPLYEFVDRQGRRIYTTRESVVEPGYTRSPAPLARVWPSPVEFDPVGASYRAGKKGVSGPTARPEPLL